MSKVKPDALGEFIGRIRDEVHDTREKLAAELYNLPKVAEQMSAEAVKGYSSLTLTPPRPIDLRETKAAAKLVKLMSEAGANCEWRKRFAAGPANDTMVQELIISW